MANDNPDPLLDFVDLQRRDFGGNVEVSPGLWALFGVPRGDSGQNAYVQSLLMGAAFPHDSGESEDDGWTLYYVESAHRDEAVHWLDDLGRQAAGEIRRPSPAQRALIGEIAGSDMPHRLAQRLVDQHARAELGAGAIGDPMIVRGLLDRLHGREPLFFSAFRLLLSDHLFDMIVLLQQLIPEDVGLKNEMVKGSLSRDPFLRSRQDAAAEIHRVLTRFQVINPLDQQKNTTISNPYAAFMDIIRAGGEISAAIDGNNVVLPCGHFTKAVRLIRRNLYQGGDFNKFDTQAPWMTPEIAYSFRYIRQRLLSRPGLPPLDGLYMLERAVE